MVQEGRLRTERLTHFQRAHSQDPGPFDSTACVKTPDHNSVMMLRVASMEFYARKDPGSPTISPAISELAIKTSSMLDTTEDLTTM